MDHGNTKTSSVHLRLGSMTLLQLAFPEESNQNFPWEKSQWDNTGVKKKKKDVNEPPTHFCLIFRVGLKHRFHCITVLTWQRLTLSTRVLNPGASFYELPIPCTYWVFERCAFTPPRGLDILILWALLGTQGACTSHTVFTTPIPHGVSHCCQA